VGRASRSAGTSQRGWGGAPAPVDGDHLRPSPSAALGEAPLRTRKTRVRLPPPPRRRAPPAPVPALPGELRRAPAACRSAPALPGRAARAGSTACAGSLTTTGNVRDPGSGTGQRRDRRVDDRDPITARRNDERHARPEDSARHRADRRASIWVLPKIDMPRTPADEVSGPICDRTMSTRRRLPPPVAAFVSDVVICESTILTSPLTERTMAPPLRTMFSNVTSPRTVVARQGAAGDRVAVAVHHHRVRRVTGGDAQSAAVEGNVVQQVDLGLVRIAERGEVLGGGSRRRPPLSDGENPASASVSGAVARGASHTGRHSGFSSTSSVS